MTMPSNLKRSEEPVDDLLRVGVEALTSGAPTTLEFNLYRYAPEEQDWQNLDEIDAALKEGWLGYGVVLPRQRDKAITICGPFSEPLSGLFESDYPSWCSLIDFERELGRLATIASRARASAKSIGQPTTPTHLFRLLAALPTIRYLLVPVSLEDDGWEVYEPGDVDAAVTKLESLIADHFALQEGEKPESKDDWIGTASETDEPPSGMTVEMRDRIRRDVRRWIENNGRPFQAYDVWREPAYFEWQVTVSPGDVELALMRDRGLACIGRGAFTTAENRDRELAYVTELLVDELTRAGEPRCIDTCLHAVRRLVKYPFPYWDQGDPRLVLHPGRYLGLAAWGDGGLAQVLAKKQAIHEVLRNAAGRATFAELCALYHIEPTGLLSDILWASVQELKGPDYSIEPDAKHPHTMIIFKAFVPFDPFRPPL